MQWPFAKLLIDNGANINIFNPNGWTLLRYSINCGLVKRVGVLIEHGANMNAKNGDGVLPLNYAISLGNSRMLDLLLKSGIKITLRDDAGYDGIESTLQYNMMDAFKMISTQSIHNT